MIADTLGVPVNRADALHHLLQQIGIPTPTDKFSEVEVLEDLAHVLREGLHVENEVGLYARLTELGQIHLRRIKEVQALGGTHHQLLGSFCRDSHGRHF